MPALPTLSRLHALCIEVASDRRGARRLPSSQQDGARESRGTNGDRGRPARDPHRRRLRDPTPDAQRDSSGKFLAGGPSANPGGKLKESDEIKLVKRLNHDYIVSHNSEVLERLLKLILEGKSEMAVATATKLWLSYGLGEPRATDDDPAAGPIRIEINMSDRDEPRRIADGELVDADEATIIDFERRALARARDLPRGRLGRGWVWVLSSSVQAAACSFALHSSGACQAG